MTVTEKIAAYVHYVWSGRMKWIFSKSHTNDDGSLVIPADIAVKLKAKISLTYEQLPKERRIDDVLAANGILRIIKEHDESLGGNDE